MISAGYNDVIDFETWNDVETVFSLESIYRLAFNIPIPFKFTPPPTHHEVASVLIGL